MSEEKESKALLILKAHTDICNEEMGLVHQHCKLLGINVIVEEITSEDTFVQVAEKYTKLQTKFNYLYLCSHGNKDGFDINMGDIKTDMTWARFSQILCERNIMSDDSIILLACCKGGLTKVTTDIFAVCHKINYVCGVKCTAFPWDLTTGFVVFLHHMEVKNADPAYAAQKASLATDYTFVCHDRDEVEMNPSYEARRNALYYELGWLNNEGYWVETDEQIIQNVSNEVVNTLLPR